MPTTEKLKSDESFESVLEYLRKLKETSDWLVTMQSRTDAQGNSIITEAVVSRGQFSYTVKPSPESGTTYSADIDNIKDKEVRMAFLKQMCEAALLNAKPGTKLVVGADAGNKKERQELQEALDAVLNQQASNQQVQEPVGQKAPPQVIVPNAIYKPKNVPNPGNSPKPAPSILDTLMPANAQSSIIQVQIQELEKELLKTHKQIAHYKQLIVDNREHGVIDKQNPDNLDRTEKHLQDSLLKEQRKQAEIEQNIAKLKNSASQTNSNVAPKPSLSKGVDAAVPYFDPILGAQGGYEASAVVQAQEQVHPAVTPAYQNFVKAQPGLKPKAPEPVPELVGENTPSRPALK